MGLSLSERLLDRLWPHAPHSLIDGMARTSESVFARFGLTTMTEIADLMAQGSEETGAGSQIEENLNYTAARLVEVWPRRFRNLAQAAPFAHSPRLLADSVYGGRYGNLPGGDDGWSFRGRGFIQVTFRGWYQKLSAATGLDLIANPDLVNAPEHFLEVGAAFWKLDGINAYADVGDFRGETLRLNGGYINYETRLHWRAVWRSALGAS